MSGVVLEGDTRKLHKAIKNLSDIEFKKLNKNIGQSLRSSTVERFRLGRSP